MRILRSVRSPRGVRGALPSLAAPEARESTFLRGAPAPFCFALTLRAVSVVAEILSPNAGSINEVESWFNFHYHALRTGFGGWGYRA